MLGVVRREVRSTSKARVHARSPFDASAAFALGFIGPAKDGEVNDTDGSAEEKSRVRFRFGMEVE